MEINLTFLVQVINFLIFYWASSRFFLRPFVIFIQAKMVSRQQVLADFAEKELQLKSLIHERVDFAQQFKLKLKSQYELPIPVELIQEGSDMLSRPSTEDLGVITKNMVTTLVSGIKNAY